MPDSSEFTIAIVDDDTAIRRLVKHFLKRESYQVVESTTGAEARAMFSSAHWDLAVLDRRLPDIDGAVLCQELKSNPEFRARYVIMLTGEADAQDKVEGLDLGADDYITKPFQPEELLARIRAGIRIVDLQKELIATNKRLERLSITDGLTHLYNHRHFQEQLVRQFDEAIRYERPLAVAILDIDFFKKVNDTYGHGAGDDVLRKVAEIFMQSVRAADLAARYGGEEFAVMMPETNLEEAALFAEKIRALVESEVIPTSAGDVRVTISVGVSSYPHTFFKNCKDMVNAADKALYRAKRNGRNQVQLEKRQDLARPRRAAPKKDEKTVLSETA